MTYTVNGNTDDPYWEWEEAFDKFGFGDGDGVVQTWRVADALEEAGYLVQITPWGMHNTVITSILRGGVELMPIGEEGRKIGYDDPRTYLPDAIIELLDEQFAN